MLKSPSSRMSTNSDYSSMCASSDDECSLPGVSSPNATITTVKKTLKPGFCPHCSRIFQQPVILPCGHSVCSTCAFDLLPSSTSHPSARATPRMGVRSGGRVTAANFVVRSPTCPSCGAAPSSTAPIRNYELEYLLASVRRFEEPKRWEDDGICMKECRIGVIGSQGVGKTSLTRVQYGNEIMFPDLVESSSSDEATYIIDIFETKSIDAACDGYVVAFSICDRQSFYDVVEHFKKIEQSSQSVIPMILVGMKKDRERKREVCEYEAQKLAETMGCPFIEVSAKLNEGVNETFTELVRLIQTKHQNSEMEVFDNC